MAIVVDVNCYIAAWLRSFWLVSTQKRNPSFDFSISLSEVDEVGRVIVTPKVENIQVDWKHTWEKKIKSKIKKIEVEDLGKMDARDLYVSIKESKNGLVDLEKLQKEVSVLVFFSTETDQHLRLVGAKNKLQRKCSDIRSLLSHFHWRLSGEDIAFETMISKG